MQNLGIWAPSRNKIANFFHKLIILQKIVFKMDEYFKISFFCVKYIHNIGV